jgi:hypothetical protein
MLSEWLATGPFDGINNAFGQKWNIEHIGPVDLFFGSEKIEQERRYALLVQSLGDSHIALTKAAGSAPMGEHD